jgi:hypothetical protein
LTSKGGISTIGAFPLPHLGGGASPSSDDEEDGLTWSQSGRGSPTCEELAPTDTKGATKGFRVDANAGVAASVCLCEVGVARSLSSAAPLGGDGGGEEGDIS